MVRLHLPLLASSTLFYFLVIILFTAERLLRSYCILDMTKKSAIGKKLP